MLFEVILELNAKPDQSQALKNWLETNLPDTQAFDGCAAVHALEHEENSSHIVLIGFWRSRKQWEQYFEWRKDRGDFETLAPMLQSEPKVQCYTQFGEWNGGSNAIVMNRNAST